MSRLLERGQATVEFALVLPIFIVMLLSVLDLGMGIYKYNAASQAAREIARVTSVHPCADPSNCTLGDTPEVLAVIATQKALIPDLSNPDFKCVRPDGSVIGGGGSGCAPGYSVRVTVTAPYTPVSPLVGLLGTFSMQSSSTVKIQ